MAEKIKLGSNGNFGVKEGGTLAYNDENGVFKAIELASSRASGATYVAESGLISDAEVGVPRIDWTNGVGELLLEPQSTNLITYSEEFDNVYWSKGDSSISANVSLSPDGSVNADKFIPDSGVGGNRSVGRSFSSLTGLHTFSVFVKDNDFNYVHLRLRNSPNSQVVFDLTNETFNNYSAEGGSIVKIGDFYKISATFDPSLSAGTLFVSVSVSDVGGDIFNFDGDGVKGITIWGAQLEQLSYPTSYIRTEGSQVTRIADAVTGNSSLGQVINSSEGVLYAELEFFNDNSFISISDGSTSNQILIGVPSTLSVIRAVGQSGGSIEYVRTSDINAFKYNKIAFSYKNNEFKFFINGTKINEQLSGNVPLNMTNLQLAQGNNANVFYGKVKDLRVYDVALTDSELQNLTTL